MLKPRIPVVACLTVLALAGCANQLTRAGAAAVIQRAIADRRASGMINLTQGAINLQVGALHGISQANSCRSEPFELADLQRYDNARIIHLDRPEPCKWVVTLSPETQSDVPFDDGLKPPTARDYNAVSIMLSQWSGFVVTDLKQDGMRADVDAVFSYRFTQTMHQLARSQVFPPLAAGCAYDVRDSLIQCVRQLPMIFSEGRWKLDMPVIN